MPTTNDYLVCAWCDSVAKKLWRGEPVREEEYLSEGRVYGAEAIVHVFAMRFAILGARSRIDSRDTPPEEAKYLARLREILGGDYHESHARLFDSLKTRVPPRPADAGFRPGDDISLSGTQAVLRAYLGSGGEGQVWSASFLDADGKPDQATFAVKFEHQRSEVGTPDQQSLRNEYRLEERLSFLGGIVVNWNGEVNGRRVVLSEFTTGGSLRDRLEREKECEKGFHPRDAVRIIERVATTLGCLHAIEITHRDIKSANIILDPSDSPWLIDFGLASRTGEADDGRGTRLYMAPERSYPQPPPAHPEADVFSLGTVLYELLDGRPWRDWEDRVAALRNIYGIHRTPPPGALCELKDILLACLAPRQGSRYADGMQLALGLREYLIQDRVPDGEPNVCRRRPGPVAVLAARSLPERIDLACDTARCREAISTGLSGLKIPEESFRDLTEALLRVVESGVARRIAESPSGSLSLDALAQDIPGFTRSWGTEGLWAIEEWGWLLGKTWIQEPGTDRTPVEFAYSSALDSLTRLRRGLERTSERDPARRFRLRYQEMKAHGWLAWLASEKLGQWEMAISHRKQAKQIAQELGISCVILETHVHLASTLLEKPNSQDADLDHAAKLLQIDDLNDCEQQHLRQRQILLAQIGLRRGNTDAACDQLRDLPSEISSDDPDRERWIIKACPLFLEAHAYNDARACHREMLVNARTRNDMEAEWRIRASAASLAQQAGEDGWQDGFAALLVETQVNPDIHGPIALVASEAYFNAGQLDRAIYLAQTAREIQQQQRYFGGIVKTEAWLAKCHDRAGDFKQACRFAILAMLTAAYNGDVGGLVVVRDGLRFPEHYLEGEQILSLFAQMDRGEQKDLDERDSALETLIEKAKLLTDQDYEWLAARRRK